MYHLYDLFEISSGNKLDRVKMTEKSPCVNFVGRSGINNGVTAVVDLIESVEIESNLNPNKPGVYEAVYTLNRSNGDYGTTKMYVIVED